MDTAPPSHPPPPPPDLLRRSALEEAGPSQARGGSPHTLTILSWNVLADGLAQSGRWARCPPSVLEWGPARQAALLGEVCAPNPDIICLQECNHFEGFWRPALEVRGYVGAFWAKPGSPAARVGAPPDGCAVFWRADRFGLVQADGRPFDARCVSVVGAAATPRAKAGAGNGNGDSGATDEEPVGMGGSGGVGGGGGGNAPSRTLPVPVPPRGVQGALVATLTDRLSGRAVVVGCTHLKAKSGGEEDAVRGRQATEATARVVRAGAGVEKGGGAGPPPVLFLAGDFNAGPSSSAGQAPLLAADMVSVWGPADGVCGGGATPDPAASEGGGSAAHPPATAFSPWPWSTFKLRTAGVGSSSSSRRTGQHEACAPPATTDPASPTLVSRGLVDHVFYMGPATRLVGRWPPLPASEVEARGGLPCEGYPSDHVAVCVRFEVG